MDLEHDHRRRLQIVAEVLLQHHDHELHRRVVVVEQNDLVQPRRLGPRDLAFDDVWFSYREGVPVIINLTGMDDNDAKRIVDFAAGLVFGLRGSIERITNKVFLLSPANVDVGAEARAQIAQDGFFNQS